jgi:tricorn protease-like protein
LKQPWAQISERLRRIVLRRIVLQRIVLRRIVLADPKDGKTAQITRLQNEFTGKVSISRNGCNLKPDGRSIVFERTKLLDEDRTTDLWIVPLSGGNPRSLVNDGFSLSWR